MQESPEDKATQQSRRITNIILDHWYEAKKEKDFPSEKDLNPAFLESILDSCFLVKAEGILDGKYNYKFLGKNIMNAYGSDVIDHMESDKENPLAYASKAKQALKTKKPVLDEGSFHNKKGYLVKYRLCVVPLSTDGHNIDAIFGGMRFLIEDKS